MPKRVMVLQGSVTTQGKWLKVYDMPDNMVIRAACAGPNGTVIIIASEPDTPAEREGAAWKVLEGEPTK